jgi:uncharacterized protein with von Willebrand factor type A (vWA) domain
MSKIKNKPADCKEHDNGHSFVKNDAKFHPEERLTRKVGAHSRLKRDISEGLTSDEVNDDTLHQIAKDAGLDDIEDKAPMEIAAELGITELYLKNSTEV